MSVFMHWQHLGEIITFSVDNKSKQAEPGAVSEGSTTRDDLHLNLHLAVKDKENYKEDFPQIASSKYNIFLMTDVLLSLQITVK